ncbi:peptidoglycan-binding protein [Desulfosporosinus sp. Tol-M]|jgi:Predicted glycosyl hydrolase|nr:peptidoglycan-binding protein [Desulfosporosinus sp. Tol-M]
MRLLKQGMRGSDVAEVQTRLKTWGYNPGPIDGIFGPMTLKAVIQFQTARGLKPDGIVGPITYNELQKSPSLPGTIPYIIKSGDTFYKLAQTYGIPLASLIAANPGVDPNKLYIGQQIRIPQTTRKRSVAAWIPYWLQAEAFAVVQNNPDLFTTLSPFWYELTSDGGLNVLTNGEDPTIINYSKSHGMDIVPLITNNYQSQPLSAILNDPALRHKHIQAIVNKVSQMGYAGIEIDYENLLVTDKEVFVLFLRELKTALGVNKKVVATLMAKTNSTGNTSGATAQDYYGIGQVVDTVRIMAYEYSYTTPGPIAPANWVKQVFTYAVTVIPREKLEAGLPTYGYDWGTRRTAVSYQDAMNTAKTFNVPIIEDSQNGPHYNYTSNTDIPHEVWFTNARNFKTLLEIVKQLNLHGIAIWHPGNDDPAIYEVIRNS